LKNKLQVAQLQRKRPGEQGRRIHRVPVQPSPNSATGLERVEAPPPRLAPDNYIPIPDRWRLINDLGLVKEDLWDPYNRNFLKADRPVYKDWFFNLTLISDTTFEPRSTPTPVGLQGGNKPNALGIFGDGDQYTFNQNIILGLVLYKGDTVFRPPDYEFRITPVVNYNYTRVKEVGALNVDPRRGDDRHDSHVGIQELFFDYHIRNVSDRYDFDSVRIGIQPFSSDFRGFLFQDNQLGIRLFGNRDNNLWQYNLAWFRKLEKDSNSGLNDLSTDVRNDDTFIFNLYRQDWPVLGFTTMGTIIHNRNGEDESFFNANGFIERPASLGNERFRRYRATYLGLHGDGHFGRVNLTYGAYYAFGNESQGTFANKPQKINAYYGAAEVSVDYDWIRARVHGVHASGDDDPFDGKAEGFDAIFENPIIAGADTSFWIRQGIPNIGGGGVTASTRNGVLNNLRSSKEHGQSNFSNPGVTLVGAGADFDVLPELRFSANVNHIWFTNTATIEVARNQGSIEPEIGLDLSGAFIYRPFMHQNIVFRLSGAVLVPGTGYKQLFGDDIAYSVLGNLMLVY
ncbi:MAG: hypothetical protein HOI95_14685, partial [Chromatiales bacterium]|nr:hypothetical protein [Chromatiales bacterium]